jgi:uncharacterized repeat protein (TIGR03803 family)
VKRWRIVRARIPTTPRTVPQRSRLAALLGLGDATGERPSPRFIHLSEELKMGVFLSRFTLAMSVGVPLLAACGGSQPLIGAPGAMPQALALAARTHSPSYKVLHSFSGLGDGYYPAAGLIDINGTLYGTTTSGGAYRNGTVFSITQDGKEKVLHSFGKGADGVYPRAGLIDVGGRLYGTTFYGGGSPDSCDDFYHGCGTVFIVTTGGSEKVLHSFNHPKVEGSSPGGLIDVGGTLYGATGSGGPYDGGTIFSMTMRGTEKVLHSFGHGNDGYAPNGALIDVGGTLYGTTFNGGRYDNHGTVFRITTGGVEKVLHSFGKGTDGSEVAPGLVSVGAMLYGTTFQGGYETGGTVFRIRPDGKEKVLYYFGEGSSYDGYYPLAALIDVGGTLYGTTYDGGAYRCGSIGCGTVFSITTAGAERVLHSFGSGSDGVWPVAPLIAAQGTFYGTTYNGGAYNAGTVFALTP